MFIKKLQIKNFRLFSDKKDFEVDNINIPDGQNEGSGLTLFIGENGCGKTTLLDAFVLPLLLYKSENFSISDFYNIENKTIIEIFSDSDFEYAGVMPKAKYKAKGFEFNAGIRSRENKSFLSSIIVSDQKYIKADGETKPKDGAADLRISVNNPWLGQRFNENDILFLDKKRTYQTRSGTYNTTRFDRLMEDFDYQYLKSNGEKEGAKVVSNFKKVDENLQDIKKVIENNFLIKAIQKFNELSQEKVSLNYINNLKPHGKAFFALKKDNGQQIKIDMLGSGHEMIFSLIYSFYLSQQSEKQLIILIDEPELHLHPKLQEDFVKILLEFSKDAQIVLTSHSPLFVKQLLYNDKVQIDVLKKDSENISISKIDDKVLPYLSASEINFIAFELATEEYHNELYEELCSCNNGCGNIKQFDIDFFQAQKGELANLPWKGNQNEVSIHTFLRNQIHHQADNGKPDYEKLKASIEKMREFLTHTI